MRKISLVVLVSFLVSLFVPAIAMSQSEISIAISDSPWLPGFQRLVAMYEEHIGNKVELNIFPFAGLLPKQLSAVGAQQSEFDILILNENWYSAFYDAKFVTPLKEIDPNFELDPAIIEYAYSTRWDHELRYSTPDGILYGIPINGNIQLFFYRGDLYEEAGFLSPVTWDDVIMAAEKIGGPPKLYGYCNRGSREGVAISWDWLPFLRGFGSDIFADEPYDWTVTVNSEEGLKALELYLELAKFAPPDVANINQAEQTALLAGGRLLQTICVCAAYPDMDDPEKSVVVNKIQYTVVPKPKDGKHSSSSGIWVMAIPSNLPDSNKKAALEFMKWATSKESQMEYARMGAIPVRQDVYESELAALSEFRYMKAMAESTPYIDPTFRIPEGPQISEEMSLRLNQAIAGELEAKEALDLMAEGIFKIMQEAGYKTGLLK